MGVVIEPNRIYLICGLIDIDQGVWLDIYIDQGVWHVFYYNIYRFRRYYKEKSSMKLRSS